MNIREHISDFFHNSHLIKWIQQNKICKRITDLTRDWTKYACLVVKRFNHCTRMFSVLVWGCNWILFIHGWFCPIGLIHLIGRKSFSFWKKTKSCMPLLSANKAAHSGFETQRRHYQKSKTRVSVAPEMDMCPPLILKKQTLFLSSWMDSIVVIVGVILSSGMGTAKCVAWLQWWW